MVAGHAGHADRVGPGHASPDSRSPDPDAARRAHYGAFYGLSAVGGDAPIALVHGNCQAESLRIAIAGEDLTTVRIPPVHELTAEDLPHLERWLARADVLISQPVRSGYRGLALGTAELVERLRPSAQVLAVPVIRFSGLYPHQVIVRPPGDPSLSPPGVPYHDLRTLVSAAGLGDLPPVSAAAVRRVAEHSRGELRRREAAHGTLVVSDLFEAPHFAQMRTINHPGNAIWAPLALRVRSALSLAAPQPLARELLNGIHAPRETEVITAFGLTEPSRPDWTIDGVRVEVQAIAAAQLAWYGEHPETVQAGLARHAEVLAILAAG